MNLLGILADELQSIGIPYAFMEWTPPVAYPYFIGEYSETVADTESGYEEGTVQLTGTTRGPWLELEDLKSKIKSRFPPIYGLRKSTDDGAVAFFYGNSFPVPTGEADLKRIQINLQVKHWRNEQ